MADCATDVSDTLADGEAKTVAHEPVRGRRFKIVVTVDPGLLGAVDRYVAEHPEADRSKIIDEALWLWLAKEQERAMREQFEAPEEAPPEEIAAWRAIRNAAWEHQFARWDKHERLALDDPDE